MSSPVSMRAWGRNVGFAGLVLDDLAFCWQIPLKWTIQRSFERSCDKNQTVHVPAVLLFDSFLHPAIPRSVVSPSHFSM